MTAQPNQEFRRITSNFKNKTWLTDIRFFDIINPEVKIMKNFKRGYKFRIGSLIFVVVNYDGTSHKYLCRLQNTGKIYYFSAQQIFRI